MQKIARDSAKSGKHGTCESNNNLVIIIKAGQTLQNIFIQDLE